eukprot:CAMPEP_0115317834 /NCGR_PEP_ID=MMETSP0270-20121206/78874_1 /TAXON_ID=71861 /ORGANISM="Scrippsiella trochoidea, Strain CCMP3099" /LENGTH=44 /DNA_ID= /DNA_START= /DNA_END= /DNA_ORIENTATION=
MPNAFVSAQNAGQQCHIAGLEAHVGEAKLAKMGVASKAGAKLGQ